MKTIRTARSRWSLAALAMLTLAAACSRAPEIGSSTEWDPAFEAIEGYEFGQSRVALSALNEITRFTAGSPQRRAQLAARMAEFVQSDATLDAKQFVSRQLALIGTRAEVKVIAPLLMDEAMADNARLALESIPGKEAGRALRKGLGRSEPGVRIGILNSLGERRDPRSVRAIRRYLKDRDPATVRAAAGALGKIGGRSAGRALATALDRAAPSARDAIADALMTAADGFMERGEERLAAAIYAHFDNESESRGVRMTALVGLVAARPHEAMGLLTEMLAGDNARDRATAIALIRSARGQAVTDAAARAIEGAAPAIQVGLIEALALRGDRGALPALLKAASSDSTEVRLASLKALGSLGDASTVTPLLALARSSEEAHAEAAREALASMRGEGVDWAMIQSMEGAEGEELLELIRLFGARRSALAHPFVKDLLASEDEQIRLESFRTLAPTAGPMDLSAIVYRLRQERNDEVRAEAEKTVATIAKKFADPAEASRVILDEVPYAPTSDTKASLLRLLGPLGGSEALELLLSALGDEEPAIAQAAFDALADWPDAAPAPRLLAIVRNAGSAPRRAGALEAYVRLIGLPSEAEPAERLAQFHQAMQAAEGDEEKALVLGGLRNLKTLGAIELLEPHLGAKPPLAEAAMGSAAEIGPALSGAYPDRVKALMQRVAENTSQSRTRTRAERVIRTIERFEGYITAWEVSGPYSRRNTEGSKLFDIGFAPEGAFGSADSEAGGEAEWKLLAPGAESRRPWMLNLARSIGGDNKAVYLRTRVWAPEKQKATLELGSDDGIKAWLGGKLIHANNASRGVQPGDDKVAVELEKGWNTLVLKVTNGGGDWGACARFVGPGGKAIQGVHAEIVGTGG